MKDKHITVILIFVCLSFSSFLVGYFIINDRGNIGSSQILSRFTSPNPTEKTEKSLAITSEPVISFVLKGKVIRYVKRDGQVLELNPSNLITTPISKVAMPAILGTIWSPDADNLIYLANRSDGNRFVYLNLNTGVMKNLDHSIETLAFSPDSSRIAYVARVGNSGSVIIQYLDSSDFKRVADVRLKASSLSWLDDNTLYVRSLEGDRYTSFLLTFDGQLSKITQNKNSLEELPSGDGGKVLLSSSVGSRDAISVFDVSQGKETPLGLETRADKCGWSIDNKHVFCAVPKNQSGQEDIYTIDTETKEKKLVGPLESYIVVEKLLVSELEDYAIIQNSLDHKLYRVSLDL